MWGTAGHWVKSCISFLFFFSLIFFYPHTSLEELHFWSRFHVGWQGWRSGAEAVLTRRRLTWRWTLKGCWWWQERYRNLLTKCHHWRRCLQQCALLWVGKTTCSLRMPGSFKKASQFPWGVWLSFQVTEPPGCSLLENGKESCIEGRKNIGSRWNKGRKHIQSFESHGSLGQSVDCKSCLWQAAFDQVLQEMFGSIRTDWSVNRIQRQSGQPRNCIVGKTRMVSPQPRGGFTTLL